MSLRALSDVRNPLSFDYPLDRFGGKQTSRIFPRDASQDEGFQKFIRFLWGNPVGRMISLLRLPF